MESDILEDDVAIVTGAIKNIGLEIAEQFAKEGAHVVIVHKDETRAQTAASKIRDKGGDAIAVTADITDPNEVDSMVKATEERFGPVDILVNNAAVSDRSHFLDLSPMQFAEVISINLQGTFLCTQAAAKSMRKSGGGRIVNISSTSAHKGRPSAVAYATSKCGILNFTRSVAKALSEYDIRVNTLSPTRTGSRVGEKKQRRHAVPDDILVGRWGHPQDQARAALFLVNPENEFINGIELLVDGGSST